MLGTHIVVYDYVHWLDTVGPNVSQFLHRSVF